MPLLLSCGFARRVFDQVSLLRSGRCQRPPDAGNVSHSGYWFLRTALICINISNLVLTNCNSCCMISNVSGRYNRHSNLCASGSVGGARPCQGRGRGFESRLALSFNKKGIRWMSFFVKSSPAGLEHSSFFAPVRSLPNSVHRTLTSSLRSGPRRTDVHWTSCFSVLLRSLPNSVHRTLTSSLRSGPRRADKSICSCLMA